MRPSFCLTGASTNLDDIIVDQPRFGCGPTMDASSALIWFSFVFFRAQMRSELKLVGATSIYRYLC